MIRPTAKRILVKMLPAQDDLANPLNLTLVDQKKHFEHSTRKAVVVAAGSGTKDVKTGDRVVIRGDAGFTLDGDPEVQRAEYGESYRWLKEHEIEAVEEVA